MSEGRNPNVVELKATDKEKLKELIFAHTNIALTVHIHPDGDALGSLLAFYEALKNMGKTVAMFEDDTIPGKYNFLSFVKDIQSPEALADFNADLLIVLDASTHERIGRIGQIYTGEIINLDHHVSNSRFADTLYLRSDFAATGEVLVDLLTTWQCPITQSMAQALYMAIATDCGFFKFSNTTEHTLEMAALCLKAGAKPNIISEHVEQTSVAHIEVMKEALNTISFAENGKYGFIALNQELMKKLGDDTDGYVDLIRNVDTVDIAVLLKSVSAEETRVSLRSKTIDVNAIAQRFGGGGHVRASGCTIKAGLEEAKNQLLKEFIH